MDLGGVADVCRDVLCFPISSSSGLYSHFFSHILNLAVRRGGEGREPRISSILLGGSLQRGKGGRGFIFW